ncbi:unnamed protein product [Amoebophrya sp. A120]|nr:unnamed protein product [Amoebophrya sp. A120]|eukprot:GSA120T00024754001.1
MVIHPSLGLNWSSFTASDSAEVCGPPGTTFTKATSSLIFAASRGAGPQQRDAWTSGILARWVEETFLNTRSLKNVTSSRSSPTAVGNSSARMMTSFKDKGFPLAPEKTNKSPREKLDDALNANGSRKDPLWFQDGKHPFFTEENYGYLPPVVEKKKLRAADGKSLDPPKDFDKLRENAFVESTGKKSGPLQPPPTVPAVGGAKALRADSNSGAGKLAKGAGVGVDFNRDTLSEDEDDGDNTIDEDVFEMNDETPEPALETMSLDGSQLSEELVKMNYDATHATQKKALVHDFYPENRSPVGGYCPPGHPSCMTEGAVGYDLAEEMERTESEAVEGPDGELLLKPAELKAGVEM